MTPEEIYEIWRPSEGIWSRWVKPILFSFMKPEGAIVTSLPEPGWQVPLDAGTAIIADLPGTDGVALGMALARTGYRPIPVYNATPFAVTLNTPEAGRDARFPPTVDLAPIVDRMLSATSELRALELSASAPPVFLLDANRRGGLASPGRLYFDNRSFVSPSDFPSAGFFRDHGTSRIVVVRPAAKLLSSSKIPPDLATVLMGLQNGGLAISEQASWEPWHPAGTVVKPPGVLGSMWNRLVAATYKRGPLGNFGEIVKHSGGG